MEQAMSTPANELAHMSIKVKPVRAFMCYFDAFCKSQFLRKIRLMALLNDQRGVGELLQAISLQNPRRSSDVQHIRDRSLRGMPRNMVWV